MSTAYVFVYFSIGSSQKLHAALREPYRLHCSNTVIYANQSAFTSRNDTGLKRLWSVVTIETSIWQHYPLSLGDKSD